MNNIAVKIENLSKQYRLGVVGTGTLSHDLNRWFARIRGKEDPTLKIGQENQLAESNEQSVKNQYVWALKDINLDIQQGEVLGIIGKNGAGKSTLLKILSRVTGPTTGRVKVNGRIASLLEVGTGFHPELTGRENIFLNGAILGMRKPEIRKKLDEIIDFAGVAKYVDTPVKRYSSGMYVRLAFAVAAHLEPDILVVDEVLAVGDAEFQKKAIGKMQDVSRGEGRTVLFVSHNMASIESLCTKSILLNNGKIEYQGNVNKSIEKYIKHRKSEKIENVAERIDRSGAGEIKAWDVWIENKDGERIQKIQTGDNIKFAVKIKQIQKPFLDGKLTVSFALNSITNIQLSDISNFYTGDLIEISKDEEYKIIKASIDRFPFNNGIFSYNVMIKLNGTEQDWVKNVNMFEVENGDFYKSGKIPTDNRLLNLNIKWENEFI